jgi:hypothetical protein
VTRRSRTFAPVLLLATLLVGLGACGDDDDDTASDATTTSSAADSSSTSSTTPGSGDSSSSDPSGATTTAPPGEGCTGGGVEEPTGEGVGAGDIVDVDGDGRGDRAWLSVRPDGSRELGVATAAGGGDAVPMDSASPNVLTLLAVDADEEPPVELFMSDGRTVELWAFADCALAAVTDPDGAPYLFDLGFRGTGTGVGCRDADGGRELVGLNVVDDDGTVVDWTRTVIERDELIASNGATDEGRFERPADDGAIELLHTVSCGDVTMTSDGIQQPQL